MAARHWTLQAKTRAKATPTVAEVDAHLANGNFAAAAILARKLHDVSPTADSLSALRRVILSQAQSAIDRKHAVDFEQAMAAAEALPGGDGEWATTRAMLLAQGGQLPQALMLLPPEAGDAARMLAIAHAADRSVRHRSYANLPDELHEGCKAVVLAFAKQERGDEDGTRELLQPIGLQSPFLDWKLLLRGLIAYTANDDAKAIENWQRLVVGRLPARLAAPLRASIDAAYREAMPAAIAGRSQAQANQIIGAKCQSHLAVLRQTFGQMQPLDSCWKHVDAAYAALKPLHPDLAARLAHCTYHAIHRQGSPDDLARYRAIFGRPTDDPEFFRLQAMVYESQGHWGEAIWLWEKYERWLATKPSGWESAYLRRTRSLLLQHLGTLRERENDPSQDSDLRKAMQEMFGMPPRKPARPPAGYYQKAVEADPTAIAPRLTLLRHLAEQKPTESFLKLAADTLEIDPENLEALQFIADALQRLRRPSEALPYRKQALAKNPLDTELFDAATECCIAAARREMINDNYKLAEEILVENAPWMAAGKSDLTADSVCATLHRKQGRTLEADALRDLLTGDVKLRLLAAFQLSVDAELARLKPAEKTAAKKGFTDAMTATPTVEQVIMLHAGYRSLEFNDVDYRGRKSLRKKIEALVVGCGERAISERDCDSLCRLLHVLANDRVSVKVCERLVVRFPLNVAAKLTLAKGLAGRKGSWSTIQRIRTLLNSSRDIVERTGEGRQWLEEIDELLAASRKSADFRDFPFPFGR